MNKLVLEDKFCILRQGRVTVSNATTFINVEKGFRIKIYATLPAY